MSTVEESTLCYDVDKDIRLGKVWSHFADLVGDTKFDELGYVISGVFDYKGYLRVATQKKLSTDVENAFRRAWATFGGQKEQVEFLDERSPRWDEMDEMEEPDGNLGRFLG